MSKLGDKGVSFEVNALVGKLYDIDELMEDRGFDAVFVGTGAGFPATWVSRARASTACRWQASFDP